jgi:hypothetical protein
MSFFTTRRARLRPEYAHLYPRIASGIWLGARAAALAVQCGLMHRKLDEATGQRLLSDEHFDFRGGRSQPRGGGARRTRATDSREVVARNDGAAGADTASSAAPMFDLVITNLETRPG